MSEIKHIIQSAGLTDSDNNVVAVLSFIHNMPNIPGLSFNDAITNWHARIIDNNDITEANFVEYVYSKNIDFDVISVEDYIRKNPEDEVEMRKYLTQLKDDNNE